MIVLDSVNRPLGLTVGTDDRSVQLIQKQECIPVGCVPADR